MSRKRIEVVELNKKENKILLEKKDNWFILLLRRRGILFYLLLILLSIAFIGFSILYTVWKLKTSDVPRIEVANEKIDVSFGDGVSDFIFENITPITEKAAKNLVIKKNIFSSKGEVLILKKVESGNYTIYYFSDGYALKISKDGKIKRIAPLENGQYGIQDNGDINIAAKVSEVTVTKMVQTSYGNITYYSDGSAMINDSDIDMFVRYSGDIHDNYISLNKVSYLKDTDKIGNNQLKYFYDGTILVNDGNHEYIVRNSEDIITNGDNIVYPNNNIATVIDIKNLDNNIKVTYFSDGGAIISQGSNIVSVRRSNSIIINDNKLIEIIDSDLVDVSYKNGDDIYYTNGAAIVNYNGNKVYVPDNSDIKYNDNNKINDIDGEYYRQDSNKKLDDKNVSIYGDYTLIDGNQQIKIVPTEDVIYDSDGYVKDIDELESDIFDKEITITNSTNDKIKYKVVLEKSNNTTLDTQYIHYMFLYNTETHGPGWLNDIISSQDDINKQLGIDKTNYVLLDASLEAYQTDKINLTLWTDYETIPNSMMNKVFLGTIRVYAYIEK